VALVRRSHPNVRIYTPAIDRGLNPHKFIVPGLGDFGDRLYGTA
jgi:uracil phosphoribosyltransferase